jgi:valyl-tRNA synthetase
MAEQLDKAYNPKQTENKIYQRWERSGFFNPDNLPGKRIKSFSISMPPPNVTGELHLGHATGITIEDIMTRYHRMKGDKTLFLPGTDHAGISTQIMVERLIAKEGVDRNILGREQFIKRVWDWKKKYGSRITEQIRQLGASCDWSREHFTMDATLTEAVQTAFIKMYDDGLIYRGHRIVNWCPRCGTAISDLEVKHVAAFSKLWFIRYPLAGSTKYIAVATTRPETMLGDSAVAVNPKDKRYTSLVGKTVILPLMERAIPIIADSRVDMNFGTGAVKVTPAHDPLDYEIGLKHKLPIINVIGQDNHLTKEAGEFYGKSTQEARLEIIRRLEEEGLIEKIIDYAHNQARCDRCNTPIEPLISKQWFVKIKLLAKPALEAVKSGKIKIVPKRFAKVYFHWLNNIHDWCISRQLWWGHQMPIWYCADCDEPIASLTKPKVCKKCKGLTFIHEHDTLDTWFSSGLWTFSTLGWPQKTKDLKIYHPTSVMETGWDILFFWIVRMIMMSLYLKKEVPFKTVYLHGLVLDKDGKKMSKSKGTGIDPIPMADKYGTDAIRLSLVLGAKAGQDYRLYEEKIAGYRNYVNKLWNVSRFILSQSVKPPKKLVIKTLADQWIVSRLQNVITSVTNNIENFNFSEAGTILYDFLWHEFADWYLETSKIEKNISVLHYVLENILKLAHPFMPFVTETIWSYWQGNTKNKMLMIQPWPQADKKLTNKTAEKEFKSLQEFNTAFRNYRSEHKTPSNLIEPAILKGETKKIQLLRNHSKICELLSKVVFPTKIEAERDMHNKPDIHIAGVDCFFPTYKRDETIIQKEITEISNYILRLEQKLTNTNFLKNAPPEIVQKEKDKLSEQQDKLKKLL